MLAHLDDMNLNELGEGVGPDAARSGVLAVNGLKKPYVRASRGVTRQKGNGKSQRRCEVVEEETRGASSGVVGDVRDVRTHEREPSRWWSVRRDVDDGRRQAGSSLPLFGVLGEASRRGRRHAGGGARLRSGVESTSRLTGHHVGVLGRLKQGGPDGAGAVHRFGEGVQEKDYRLTESRKLRATVVNPLPQREWGRAAEGVRRARERSRPGDGEVLGRTEMAYTNKTWSETKRSCGNASGCGACSTGTSSVNRRSTRVPGFRRSSGAFWSGTCTRRLERRSG